MRIAVGLALLALAFCAASRAQDDEPIPDLVQAAYDIARKDLSDEDWKKYIRKTDSSYETWQNDTPDGDLNRYLNDKLIEIAPSVRNGEIKALKRAMYWLALYKHYECQPPWYVRDVATQYRRALNALLRDFSWERASELIKREGKGYEERLKQQAVVSPLKESELEKNEKKERTKKKD